MNLSKLIVAIINNYCYNYHYCVMFYFNIYLKIVNFFFTYYICRVFMIIDIVRKMWQSICFWSFYFEVIFNIAFFEALPYTNSLSSLSQLQLWRGAKLPTEVIYVGHRKKKPHLSRERPRQGPLTRFRRVSLNRR